MNADKHGQAKAVDLSALLDDTNWRGTPHAAPWGSSVGMTGNAVAKRIVDVAFRAHRALGPGLLESVYEAVLATELRKSGLGAARQQAIPVVYEGTRFEMGSRGGTQETAWFGVRMVRYFTPVYPDAVQVENLPHMARL
jgi:hypothetical protein